VEFRNGGNGCKPRVGAFSSTVKFLKYAAANTVTR
jgi:hypothetical protein